MPTGTTTYTAVLDVDRPTAEFVSQKLASHRRALGTRKGARTLGPLRSAVLRV